ncbi:MAG: hypothetical protein KDA69_05010 [Planctomycetaceae bacterium]|nr:hypothetical protein [Planctomycetaceae bacterium]
MRARISNRLLSVSGNSVVVGGVLLALMNIANADDPTPVPSGATLQTRTTPHDPAPPENFPDKYAWQLFVQVNQRAQAQGPVGGDQSKMTNNALWETWADDQLTFPEKPNPDNPPQWPDDTAAIKRVSRVPFGAGIHGQGKKAAAVVDIGPLVPGGIAVPNGVGEEIHRNKATFDYIIENNLWYQEGVAKFFSTSAEYANDPVEFAKVAVNFPVDSIEVKGNWVVIDESQKSKYHWNYNAEGQLLGLVAMHISSKALPNWFWSTFEHEDNPGFGDYIGIHDSFGADPPHIPSNTKQLAQVYPPSRMTPQLLDLLRKTGFSGSWGEEWRHYRLKGSQVDFTDSAGRPLLLGNSVTESGFVPTASCITCHSRAAVNSQGGSSYPIFGEKQALPLVGIPQQGQVGSQTELFNTYNGSPDPAWFFQFSGTNTQLLNLQTDFVWAIPFRAKPANPKP